MSLRKRLLSASLAFVLLSGAVWAAQAPTDAARPGRTPRIMPMGAVVSVTPEAITLKNARGTETVVPLEANAAVNTLKTMKLADIKEAKWATVAQMPARPNAPESNVVNVRWMTIAPKAPEMPAAKEEASAPALNTRPSLCGMLSTEGTTPTLKVADQTLELRLTPRTRVYEATPATMADVKPETNVLLDLKMVDGKTVATAINVLPEGEEMPAMGGGGGRGGQRPPRGGQ